MLDKLIRGTRGRKTRLHDEKGNFVGFCNLVAHGPPAVLTAALRLSVGYRPEVPWISYRARRRLARFLTPASRVLEFGSGMSTIWYARRAGEVCAVEDSPEWYARVRALIRKQGLPRVTYALAQDERAYCTFMSHDTRGFDLIMVDGSYRARCVEAALPLLRRGGILYLDNSDKNPPPDGGDMRLAEQLVRGFAAAKAATLTEYTDFAPTQLFVEQGLLLRLPD